MNPTFALLFALAAAAPQEPAVPPHDDHYKPGETFEEHFCGEAMGVHLPKPQGTPAPNIELLNFQYHSPDDRCGRNVETDELMRLHAGVKSAAAATLADSSGAYSVMVRYTLTPDRPAEFDMKVKDASDADDARLTAFYHASAALKDYHSRSGTTYVVFQYRVSPQAPAEPAK
ncbi:hypothetical protein [Lysobacter silvisoli]|uniref:Uncharacterized protein n=1 Tax=Lysobacter silvisoli TaxID=2293254 RepID=A0A371JY35_9GAMM|nr:hypothetical protein [Lysobacter silvisoli]RDZ26571.1 hypothetical protein DX914_16425 [Lysobacter silvisoli]